MKKMLATSLSLVLITGFSAPSVVWADSWKDTFGPYCYCNAYTGTISYSGSAKNSITEVEISKNKITFYGSFKKQNIAKGWKTLQKYKYKRKTLKLAKNAVYGYAEANYFERSNKKTVKKFINKTKDGARFGILIFYKNGKVYEIALTSYEGDSHASV